MRVVLVGLVVIAACRGPRRAPPIADEPVPAIDAGAADARAPDPVATDAPPADAAAPAPIPMPADAIVSVLAAEAGAEPVLLVERGGAIVATTPSGKHARVLAKASARRVSYDARTWTLWFLRGDRLIALDLTRAAIEEVVVAEAVPDAPLLVDARSRLEREYCPEGCIAIRASAPLALAVVEAAERPITPAAEEALRRARTTHPPRLTDAGRDLFVGRPAIARPAAPAYVALSEARWSAPPSARKRPSCAYDTCGRTFVLERFSRSLLVSGRTCDCRAGGCWGLCVWFDTATGRYASLRAPGRWLADVAGEPACHPAFDAGGTAYVIGGWVSPGPLAVCTARVCRAERGTFVGWLEEGFSTDDVQEDASTCPH